MPAVKLDLSGKRALVTGSTAGIGFAIAQGLARAGAEVIVNGRTERRVELAVAALLKDGNVWGAAADVGTPEGCERLVEQARHCDILVNNAGVFEPKGFFEISDTDWAWLFEVNVMSGVRLSRALAPGMKARGWGRVVFISSESALQIPAEMVHYGTTKTAQLAVSRGLAETLAGTGVTVNAVLPGPTRSEGVAAFVRDLAKREGKTVENVEAEFFRSTRPSSLIRRFATPEEIANLVVYLCSPQASATTGSAMRVDGGVVRSIA